jgi:hypothetical protein
MDLSIFFSPSDELANRRRLAFGNPLRRNLEKCEKWSGFKLNSNHKAANLATR